MFKKVLVFVVLLSLLIGSVSASSINGDYLGNPIVKVKSDGKDLMVEDVPGIIYKDRTMVPIYMLRQLGVDVVWEGSDYSVDVKINGTITNNTEIDHLKTLSKISNQYFSLQIFGNAIFNLGNHLSSAFSAINSKRNEIDRLDNAVNKLNSAIDNHKFYIASTEALISSVKDYNYDLSDLKDILNQFAFSLEYYKLSYQGLENLYYYNRDSDFDQYLDNMKKADDFVHPAILKSQQKYNEIYNIIQQF